MKCPQTEIDRGGGEKKKRLLPRPRPSPSGPASPSPRLAAPVPGRSPQPARRPVAPSRHYLGCLGGCTPHHTTPLFHYPPPALSSRPARLRRCLCAAHTVQDRVRTGAGPFHSTGGPPWTSASVDRPGWHPAAPPPPRPVPSSNTRRPPSGSFHIPPSRLLLPRRRGPRLQSPRPLEFKPSGSPVPPPPIDKIDFLLARGPRRPSRIRPRPHRSRALPALGRSHRRGPSRGPPEDRPAAPAPRPDQPAQGLPFSGCRPSPSVSTAALSRPVQRRRLGCDIPGPALLR